MNLWRPALMIPATAALVFAHVNRPFEPHDLWSQWSFEPGVVIPLCLAAALFAKGARSRRGMLKRQYICFWSGWVSLTLALASPIHSLGEALFSAHMAQHEILMLVAAPLLTLSRPLTPMLWSLPIHWRRAVGQWSRSRSFRYFWNWISTPLTAWCIHAVALWIWHIPILFESTLSSEWAHAAQHVSFLGSALLFWWSLFYARGRIGYGAALMYVFTTAIHTSILGALLTFSQSVWYPAYAGKSQAWGLTAIEDQQLGGLIMWIPGGLVYLVTALILLNAWLQESDAAAGRGEYAA